MNEEEKTYRKLLALFKQEEGLKIPPIKFIKSVAQAMVFQQEKIKQYRELVIELSKGD